MKRKIPRYRLSLSDDSRLRLMAEVKLPMWQWILAVVAFSALAVLAAALLLSLTPLRGMLPGYMARETRAITEESMLRLDSLQAEYERDRAYIDNIMNVLDTDRAPADSMELVVNPRPMTADSLLPRSPEEDKFIRMMEQREKYNLSILAPLAAEGMMFNPLSDECVITEASRKSTVAEVVVASGSPVGAIADGTVVDSYYSPRDGGYVITVQHSNGFMSRVSHLGTPLAGRGDYVQAGQIIAFPPEGSGRSSTRVNLEIWRNGDRLIPAEVL